MALAYDCYDIKESKLKKGSHAGCEDYDALASWLAQEIESALSGRSGIEKEIKYAWKLYQQDRTRSAPPWPNAADLTSPIARESVDAFAARLTERLRRAIDNGVRGGIAAYVAVHPVDGIDAGGLAKRITGQMWNTLKTHPDVRTRHGKFPDEIARQLEACRTECAEKSTLLAALRSRDSGGLMDLLSELRQHIQHRWTADPEKIEDWYERLATACASGS